MSIPDALDDLAAQISTRIGLPVTRDPDLVQAPGVFMDLPQVTAVGAGFRTLAVPLFLVADGPTVKATADQLLDLTPALIDAVREQEAEPRPLSLGEKTYPAMVVTATVTITRSAT